LPIAIVFHLNSGQIALSFSDYFPKDVSNLSTNELLAREFRIPRLIITIIAGSGLAISGMLMQTLFRNPLAGPYVLGINSGASLMVALSLMTGFHLFETEFGLIGAGLIGALFSGLLMMALAFRLKSQISLLLVGLMFGSFTSAIVSLLESLAAAEKLKAYTIKDNVSFGVHDWDILANEWEVSELEEWGLDLPFADGTENKNDYSDKNKEIDTDEFSDKMQLTFELTSDEYQFIQSELSKINASKEIALLTLLKYES
jgi:hypothetical protein